MRLNQSRYHLFGGPHTPEAAFDRITFFLALYMIGLLIHNRYLLNYGLFKFMKVRRQTYRSGLL